MCVCANAYRQMTQVFDVCVFALISLQTQETPQHKMVSSRQHPTTATFPTLQRTAQAYQRIDCRLPVIKALSSIEGLSRTFLFTCTPPVKNPPT